MYGEPILLTKYLKKGQPITLIDVGAHNGDFTNALAKYYGIERGILIEPLPHKAARLIDRFNDKKYHVFDCVLSSKEGDFVSFEVNSAEATSSLLRIKRSMPELSDISLGDGKLIQCKSRTLDSIVLETNFERIDLLKIDVQGAEQLVLAGGRLALLSTKMIWIEVSYKPLYEGSCTFFEIYDILNKSGFRLVDLEPVFRGPDRELLQSDALFIKEHL